MTSKTPNMTRAHFELIASTIKAQREEVADQIKGIRAKSLTDPADRSLLRLLEAREGELFLLAQRFAVALSDTNPRFERWRFLAACAPYHYA